MTAHRATPRRRAAVALVGVVLLAGCGARTPGPQAPAPVMLAGHLDARGGELTLRPCGASEPVRLTGEATQALRELQAELQPHPHAELVVRGEADSVRLTEVRFVAPEGRAWCDLDLGGASLVASGNEPFWNLRVVGSEWILRRPSEPPRRLDRASATFRVEDLPCRDTMSGAWHHLTASLVVDGEQLDGCARRLGLP